MSDIAIAVDRLTKRYRIEARSQAQQGPGKRTLHALASPFRYLVGTMRQPADDELLWALQGASFEVKRGEVLGIIGRNGAGKSTLLKILARITEPTGGRAVVHGRIGSLLEVGTGFHPELTGRENTYLSGAILGMKRAEIDRKFSEIVAFAGVEKFVDTPVKRYSSGMYVRLAFAVAAFLEPEILLVDEVLAVGDLAFQQKCLGRIRELTDSGMTVLLVSHNMAAIQSSCRRALFLEQGRVAVDGEPLRAITAYRQALEQATAGQGTDAPSGSGGGHNGSTVRSPHGEGVTILGIEMFGEDGMARRDIRFGEAVRIRIDLEAQRRIERPMINFGIRRGDGVVVCNFNNWYDNFAIDYIEGRCSLEGWLPPLRLVPEYYEMHVLIWPWGGGHLEGELSGVTPYAWRTFGTFRMQGIGLNAHDGVFQAPAVKWRFQRGEHSVQTDAIGPLSLHAAFGQVG